MYENTWIHHILSYILIHLYCYQFCPYKRTWKSELSVIWPPFQPLLLLIPSYSYMHSGMILLYLAALFFTPKVFLSEDMYILISLVQTRPQSIILKHLPYWNFNLSCSSLSPLCLCHAPVYAILFSIF